MYTYQTTDSSVPDFAAGSSENTSPTDHIGFDTPPDELTSTGPFGESSISPRAKFPAKLGTKDTCGESAKTDVLDQSGEFVDSSTLLQGSKDSEIAPEKTTLPIIEAVTARSKSVSPTKSIIKHVKGIINFYLSARNESAVTLTGEGSLVLLHDYLESTRERGRTVPGAARHSLTVWPDALGVE